RRDAERARHQHAPALRQGQAGLRPAHSGIAAKRRAGRLVGGGPVLLPRRLGGGRRLQALPGSHAAEVRGVSRLTTKTQRTQRKTAREGQDGQVLVSLSLLCVLFVPFVSLW